MSSLQDCLLGPWNPWKEKNWIHENNLLPIMWAVSLIGYKPAWNCRILIRNRFSVFKSLFSGDSPIARWFHSFFTFAADMVSLFKQILRSTTLLHSNFSRLPYVPWRSNYPRQSLLVGKGFSRPPGLQDLMMISELPRGISGLSNMPVSFRRSKRILRRLQNVDGRRRNWRQT